VRPQYLLHTNDFVPQTDHLTEGDLAAAWNVLTRLEKDSKHVVIYNCGFEAGSSLGHKHLQILPLPAKEEFEFFPDKLGIDEDSSTTPRVPFRHAVKRIPTATSSAQLAQMYQSLLSLTKVSEAAGHNVLLVPGWMLVIPRSKGRKGILSANAAAMAGMVWVTGKEEVRQWVEHGPMKLLCEFGIVDKGS
jgi:ATP adenylyltransferase/5',5'''-P-1,P-4-tetraphosphate phosphorylase II